MVTSKDVFTGTKLSVHTSLYFALNLLSLMTHVSTHMNTTTRPLTLTCPVFLTLDEQYTAYVVMMPQCSVNAMMSLCAFWFFLCSIQGSSCCAAIVTVGWAVEEGIPGNMFLRGSVH